jgi:hypothetical protein
MLACSPRLSLLGLPYIGKRPAPLEGVPAIHRPYQPRTRWKTSLGRGLWSACPPLDGSPPEGQAGRRALG